MLKIVVTQRASDTVLRLEGQVIGPWVEELKRSCEPVLARGATLTLDFSDVSFVDRDGVLFLLSLRHRRAALQNCSPFIVEQLKP